MNDARSLAFQEFNDVDPEQSEATFEHGIKCADFVLAVDGILRCAKGIELIERSEIVESHHRGFLNDVDFPGYFSGEFTCGNVRQKIF